MIEINEDNISELAKITLIIGLILLIVINYVFPYHNFLNDKKEDWKKVKIIKIINSTIGYEYELEESRIIKCKSILKVPNNIKEVIIKNNTSNKCIIIDYRR